MVNFSESWQSFKFVWNTFWSSTFAVNYQALHLRDNGTWLSRSCVARGRKCGNNNTFTLARTMAWHHQAHGHKFLLCLFLYFLAILFCGSWPGFLFIFCFLFFKHYLWRKHLEARPEEGGARLGRHIRQTYPARSTSFSHFTTFNSRAPLDWQGSEPRRGESPDPLQASVEIRLKVHHKKDTRRPRRMLDEVAVRSGPKSRKQLYENIQMVDPFLISVAAFTFEPLQTQKVHWSHRASCGILFPMSAMPGSRAEKGKLLLPPNFAMLAHFSSADTCCLKGYF